MSLLSEYFAGVNLFCLKYWNIFHRIGSYFLLMPIGFIVRFLSFQLGDNKRIKRLRQLRNAKINIKIQNIGYLQQSLEDSDYKK